MATYSIADLGRRELLVMAAAIAGTGTSALAKIARAEGALQRTPGQILGPFYPLKEFPRTADLTRVPGRPGRRRAR